VLHQILRYVSGSEFIKIISNITPFLDTATASEEIMGGSIEGFFLQ
jgi:hypothetical protein